MLTFWQTTIQNNEVLWFMVTLFVGVLTTQKRQKVLQTFLPKGVAFQEKNNSFFKQHINFENKNWLLFAIKVIMPKYSNQPSFDDVVEALRNIEIGKT